MSPRPDVSEERRNQILEAAAIVFSTRGIGQTRMDDIVAESGLSKGTLYWYFKSKDDIIIGFVEQLIRAELNQLRRIADEGDRTARDCLLYLVELTVRDLQRIEAMMPIFYEFLALALRRSDVGAIFTDYFQRYMEIVTPILQDGIDQGEFRRVDAQEAALTLSALIEGTILLKIYDPKRVDLETQLKAGFGMLMDGLQTPAQ